MEIAREPGGKRNHLLAIFAVTSLAAVGVGALIAHGAGVSPAIWARDVVAWLVGAALAWAIATRMPSRMPAGVVLLVAVSALVLALSGPGTEGVHRWLALGPIRVNAAMLVLPAAVVALAHARLLVSLTVLFAGFLVVQPDASQTTAFAGAATLLLVTKRPWRIAIPACAALASLVLVAWWHPDPLAPVPEVEGIVVLAWQQSPLLAIAAVVVLGVSALAPLSLRDARPGPAAPALAVYMALTALAPAVGAFPVPLVGMTVSPILGWWLAVGVAVSYGRKQAL